MPEIFALTILFLIYSIGQVVAKKTKAILSAPLVISIILLVAFWLGLPKDIMTTAKIDGIGSILVGLVITSLGTTIDMAELRRQWKTVVIGTLAVIAGTFGIILIGGLIVNQKLAIAGAPIFSGGGAATIIMISTLAEKGLESLSVFCIMMLTTQGFIGIPVSSFLLRQEAKQFLKHPENLVAFSANHDTLKDNAGHTKKRKPLEIPGANSPEWTMVKLGLVATVSHYLSLLTGGAVHSYVFCLLLGILLAQLGFLEPGSLERTQSVPLLIFATTIFMYAGLSDATPKTLLDLLLPLLVCLVLGTIFVIITAFILSLVLKISFPMAAAIGMSCTYGFPVTMFIANEVSEAMGRTPEEKTALRNYMLPKMLTAGFVTVSIASVIVAGIVSGLL